MIHPRPDEIHRTLRVTDRQRSRLRRFNLTESVGKVLLQKSIPAQIRQLILNIGDNNGHVDGFVWESTLAKRCDKNFE